MSRRARRLAYGVASSKPKHAGDSSACQLAAAAFYEARRHFVEIAFRLVARSILIVSTRSRGALHHLMSHASAMAIIYRLVASG